MSDGRLMHLVAEITDLSRSIGSMRAQLETLEIELEKRQQEVSTYYGSAVSATTVTRPEPQRSKLPSSKGVRSGKMPSKVIRFLNQSPEREFSPQEIASALHLNVRRIYGTLQRLVKSERIIHVSEGAYRSVGRKPAVLKFTAEG